MVPRWVRGRESAEIVEPARHQIAMLGLGDSVGTPNGRHRRRKRWSSTASRKWKRRRPRARAHRRLQRAVHHLRPDATRTASDGPSRAAQLGAVAVLVRSIGPAGLRLPHTGGLPTRRTRRRFPPRRSPAKMPTGCSAWPTAASASSCGCRWKPTSRPMSPSANVVGETARPREAGRVRRHRRPSRQLGRRRRRERRWRRHRRDVGSAAADEDARTAAAPDRPRGAVDQRRERRARRPRVSRRAHRANCRGT